MPKFTEFYGDLRIFTADFTKFSIFDGVEIRIKKQVEKNEVWTPIEQINQTIRNYFRQIFQRNFRQFVRRMFRRIFWNNTTPKRRYFKAGGAAPELQYFGDQSKRF